MEDSGYQVVDVVSRRLIRVPIHMFGVLLAEQREWYIMHVEIAPNRKKWCRSRFFLAIVAWYWSNVF